MKKIIILTIVLIFLTGCTNVNDLSLDNIINTSINNRVEIFNNYRSGYKYYLPTGLKVINKEGTNEVLKKGSVYYYLYVDLISYYNNTNKIYEENKDIYYSKNITKNDEFGYLEINKLENEKYLIEIMYNYAKIEVIVASKNINNTILNAISILSSIRYNKTIINNMMSEDGYNFKEEEIDIFETKGNKNILQTEDTIDIDYNNEDKDLIE